MITIHLHRSGQTEQATSIDRAWLAPGSGVYLWVDLASPSIPESLVLSDTFAFHPLSVEDAMSGRHSPKVEAYDGYLYAILHGLEAQPAGQGVDTYDVDFFVGENFLVTVHDGRSAALDELRQHCARTPKIVGDGPVPLFHRIADAVVDGWRPAMARLDESIDALETAVFEKPAPPVVRDVLTAKREVASLRRVLAPQRDAVARLAHRDFVDISTEMSFRFRDLHDHLVRLVDDAALCDDRLAGLFAVGAAAAFGRRHWI